MTRFDSFATPERQLEYARLAADTYPAAAGVGQPPAGWLRASENLDLLRQTVPAFEKLSDADLKKLFEPKGIGARAELYLPDPALQPPGSKPVLAFKGTGGLIREENAPGGNRESATEDWVNNVIQGTGGRSPDYDYAMSTAVRLREAGLTFDITGHSKGGGMASAAAEVTGMRAITVNPAGLHPETTRRFAAENEDVRLTPASDLVAVVKVQGEVLNAGVQDAVAGWSEGSRDKLASVFQQGGRLAVEVPDFNAALRTTLVEGQHISAPTVDAFMGTLRQLSGPDTRGLLDRFPRAAGEVVADVPAMQRLPSGEFAPQRGPTLPDVTPALGPLVDAMARAADAATAGRAVGDVGQHGAHLAAATIETRGITRAAPELAAALTLDAAARLAGDAARDTGDASGQALGGARRAVGEVEASLHRGAGWVEAGARGAVAALADRAADAPMLAPGLRDSLRGAAEQHRVSALGAMVDAEAGARHARMGAGAEAGIITTVASVGAMSIGERVANASDPAEAVLVARADRERRDTADSAEALRTAGDRLPAIGALSGATASAALTAFRDEAAVMAAALAKRGAAESVERHGGATVVDSLEAREAGRRREVPEPAAPVEPQASRDRDDPAQPGHRGHALFRQIDAGVAAIDRSIGREPDDRSRNMIYALYAEVRAQGWSDIGGVVLSGKAPKAEPGEYVFAHRGPPERSDDWVTLKTAEAVATSRDQSLDRVQQLEQAQQREQAQRQSLESARGPTMA